MPFTPYHFGPSGFVGLALRRWVDLPVFVLANVIVDIEVLIFHSWPIHRYAHTLLLGTAVGAVWGISVYPLRNLFKKMMQLLRIPYRTGFWKMVVSGVLGVWLHVLIDAAYHFDVRPFWPVWKTSLWRMLVHHIGYKRTEALKGQIEIACIVLLIVAVVLYVLIVSRPVLKGIAKNETADEEGV